MYYDNSFDELLTLENVSEFMSSPVFGGDDRIEGNQDNQVQPIQPLQTQQVATPQNYPLPLHPPSWNTQNCFTMPNENKKQKKEPKVYKQEHRQRDRIIRDLFQKKLKENIGYGQSITLGYAKEKSDSPIEQLLWNLQYLIPNEESFEPFCSGGRPEEFQKLRQEFDKIIYLCRQLQANKAVLQSHNLNSYKINKWLFFFFPFFFFFFFPSHF